MYIYVYLERLGDARPVGAVQCVQRQQQLILLARPAPLWAHTHIAVHLLAFSLTYTQYMYIGCVQNRIIIIIMMMHVSKVVVAHIFVCHTSVFVFV